MMLDPVPRSLVAVDIEGYSGRDILGHRELRSALRRVCAEAFSRIGVSPDASQDQGDAFLFLIPPNVAKGRLVSDLVRELVIALRASNQNWRPETRMRLRVALHSGEVLLDGTGYGGDAVIAVTRLINAQPLKDALKTAPYDLAVIISGQLHQDVVQQRIRGTDPDEYARIHATLKEFDQPAWIHVPGTRPVPVREERAAPPDHPARTPPDGNPQEPGAQRPSVAPTPGMPIAGSMTFHGPTSFGGPAAGRDVYTADRDIDIDIRNNGRDD